MLHGIRTNIRIEQLEHQKIGCYTEMSYLCTQIINHKNSNR